MVTQAMAKIIDENMLGTGERTTDLYPISIMVPSTILRSVNLNRIPTIKQDYLQDPYLIHPDNQKFIGFFNNDERFATVLIQYPFHPSKIMIYDGQHRCTAYNQLISEGKNDTKVRVDIIAIDDESRVNAQEYLKSGRDVSLAGSKLVKSALTLIREDHLKVTYSEFDELTILRSSIAAVLNIKEEELKKSVKSQKLLNEFLKKHFNFDYPDQVLSAMLLDYDVFKEAIKLSKRFYEKKEMSPKKNTNGIPACTLVRGRVWSIFSEKDREYKSEILEKIAYLLTIDLKDFTLNRVKREISSLATKKNNAGRRGSSGDEKGKTKVAASKPVPPLLYKSKVAECDFSNMSIDIFDDCQAAIGIVNPAEADTCVIEPAVKKAMSGSQLNFLQKINTVVSTHSENSWILVFIHSSDPQYYNLIWEIEDKKESIIIFLAGFEHSAKLINQRNTQNKTVVQSGYGIETTTYEETYKEALELSEEAMDNGTVAVTCNLLNAAVTIMYEELKGKKLSESEEVKLLKKALVFTSKAPGGDLMSFFATGSNGRGAKEQLTQFLKKEFKYDKIHAEQYARALLLPDDLLDKGLELSNRFVLKHKRTETSVKTLYKARMWSILSDRATGDLKSKTMELINDLIRLSEKELLYGHCIKILFNGAKSGKNNVRPARTSQPIPIEQISCALPNNISNTLANSTKRNHVRIDKEGPIAVAPERFEKVETIPVKRMKPVPKVRLQYKNGTY